MKKRITNYLEAFEYHAETIEDMVASVKDAGKSIEQGAGYAGDQIAEGLNHIASALERVANAIEILRDEPSV